MVLQKDEEIDFPHFVGWSEKKDISDVDTYEEEHFQTRVEAEKRYAEVFAKGDLFGYLGEIGAYKTTSGADRTDWLFYRSNNDRWWQDLNIEPSHPLRNTRGYGRPYNAEYRFIDHYVPHDKTDWTE
jgi:hypothetical protein